MTSGQGGAKWGQMATWGRLSLWQSRQYDPQEPLPGLPGVPKPALTRFRRGQALIEEFSVSLGIRIHAVHGSEHLHDNELVFEQLPQHTLLRSFVEAHNETPKVRLGKTPPKFFFHFLFQSDSSYLSLSCCETGKRIELVRFWVPTPHFSEGPPLRLHLHNRRLPSTGRMANRGVFAPRNRVRGKKEKRKVAPPPSLGLDPCLPRERR